MKYLPFFLFFTVVVGETVVLKNTSIKTSFSPKGEVEMMIKDQIDLAKQTIDIAAYSFTSVPIVQKLIEAKNRGIKIRIVLDKSQRHQKKSIVSILQLHNIDFRFNDNYKIQHNKYMILDQKHVQLGSFNYTKSAQQNNAENAIIVMDAPDLAKIYTKNFNKLWKEGNMEILKVKKF